MFRRDAEGLVICPNCQKHYTPFIEATPFRALGGQERDPDQHIQDQYPKLKPYQREQLISGICSDACWDEFLGVD